MSKGVSPVAELFTEAATFQSYLEVESALARAQAVLGVIPQWAADTIATKARLELMDLKRV